MNEPSLVGHAEELVRIIRKSPQPGDAIAADYYRSKKYIGARDRRFIGEWTFATLRQLALAEAYMQKGLEGTGGDEKGLEGELEGAGGGLSGPVAALVALSRDPEAQQFIEQQDVLTQINTQQWLLDETLRRWDDAADVWRAMMQEAPFTLRVNLRRTTREKVLEILQAEEIPCSVGEHAPGAILIHKRVNLTQHPLYKDGLIEVQDEGSQLISLACDVRPGMRVLDACAGAGGKSLHLADLMQDKGTIVAQDIEWNRLKEIPKRARTAGISIIDMHHLDGRRRDMRTATPGTRGTTPEAPFDLVLIDAPCTGMGTVRRLPMVKWRLQPDQLKRYTSKQLKILEDNARHVREGGMLVYATCSILPSENEDVVKTFLQRHPTFTLDSERQVDPFHHGTDGLYWARMVRG